MNYTGGSFTRTQAPLYFEAGIMSWSRQASLWNSTKAGLVAVNEINGQSGIAKVQELLDGGVAVLLDSGVFSLASATAKAKSMPLYEVQRMPLDQLIGFDELYSKYMQLVGLFGDRLWGYVELDLGGREQKRETRRRLEEAGLRPIPVYHPLMDGAEYFDELAESYDRICIGNVVQSSEYVRLRIVTTIFERMQKYPDLWVHLLGFSPNEWLHACPVQSCDSSTWLRSVRWPECQLETTALRRFGALPETFKKPIGDASVGQQAVRLGAYVGWMERMNWKAHQDACGRVGIRPRTAGTGALSERAIEW